MVQGWEGGGLHYPQKKLLLPLCLAETSAKKLWQEHPLQMICYLVSKWELVYPAHLISVDLL